MWKHGIHGLLELFRHQLPRVNDLVLLLGVSDDELALLHFSRNTIYALDPQSHDL